MPPRRAPQPASTRPPHASQSKSIPKPKPKPHSTALAEPLKRQPTALPPARTHAASYHWPLLLNDKEGCDALLVWFEGVEEKREMPWRKKWVDPEGVEGRVLGRRAYEVWVSEIMLQQTRVLTVIPYFKNWISKWPTVYDLAQADHDEVLSVWKGLGYYSRATRLHQGAQAMVANNRDFCPIPSSAEELQGFPGIGRYTAGAISSIAFGEAEPVLDGNVARVLSRQIGLYVNVKDKKCNDFLWSVADKLVKHVSDFPNTKTSAVPGNWNQALMELGSTTCTPRPKCDDCPIQSTCRAYSEGQILTEQLTTPSIVPDIEDACSMCAQLDTEDLLTATIDEEEDGKTTKKRKVEPKKSNPISHHFKLRTSTTHQPGTEDNDEDDSCSTINGSKKRKAPESTLKSKSTAAYCALFPKKVAKKKVTEGECVVCIVELCLPGEANSKWLIEQRPATGLLASLWQFPQRAITTLNSTALDRKILAQKFLPCLDSRPMDLMKVTAFRVLLSKAKHVAEIDSLVHVFSHFKLTMHVHLFRIDIDKDNHLDYTLDPGRRWVDTESMDRETLSTGMQRCWSRTQRAL
ncbi:DNA glycosylase [Massariosphaeria phaeospora]|uniref:Adenine DNA glycosylase n=1 Tax=Massariosphaeria phaeospora TaxID=100035 RepID=A0A7C8M8T0_9PLEO|nr:DNA glycosylase [Massariosphaeria phaeospora]